MLDHLARTHRQFGNSVMAEGADIAVDTDSTQACGFFVLLLYD